MSTKFLISFLLFVYCVSAHSQTYTLNGASNNTTVTTCSGIFYDSGGIDGNYQSNEDYTITFCSSNGGALNFYFEYFDVELNWDYLSIYDGSSTASPEIAGSPFNNIDLEGVNISSTGPCITFNFDSDLSITRPGWEALITCFIPCQNVQGNLTNVTPAPNPASNAVEICQGEGVDFAAEGIYPENDDLYNQSDATSTFEWSFGDGTSATGTSANHVYSDEGIYNVILTITDVNGCENTNAITQMVFVSTTPSFAGTNMLENEICLGSQNELTGIVNTTTSSITCENFVAAEVFLPDGSGVSYSSPITLDCYGDGNLLTDIDDLEGICLNIEHSYVGDLSIVISCPNNQSVSLLDDTPGFGSGADLGIPGVGATTAGTGYDYCFTNDPTYGILTTDLPGTSQPPGSYASDNPLTGLLGCPLNGDWIITITDNAGGDNGYLFSWEINFNPILIGAAVEFTPTVVTENWMIDPNIISTAGSVITVEPTIPGINCYSYEITDSFGCAYDTTLCFDVIESSSDIQIDPVPDLCDTEGVYNVTSNTTLGVWSGDVNPDGTFNPNIGEGNYTGTLTLGSGTVCEVSESVNITVSPSPSALITGSSNLCAGDSTQLQIDFIGTSPWTCEYAIDGAAQGVFSTNENPYLFFVDLPGSFTLVSVDDLNCSGSISGSADIVISDSPQINNVLETCSTDLLSYTISFDITGGDAASYVVVGGTGTLTGSTFVSDPIANGNNYDFTVSDVNNCSTDNIMGSYNCGCAATAEISGSEGMCVGGSAELIIEFEGVGPWTFNYALEGVLVGAITTDDNPFLLTVNAIGNYTLLDVSDVNCIGTVSGTAEVYLYDSPTTNNVLETCSMDLLSYTISFDITEGDAASYEVAGGTGTLTGGTFVSDPIANGDNYNFTVSDVNNCATDNVTGSYNCGCLATATISGDVSLCDGVVGNTEIDFTGVGPWTFSYSINGIIQGFETVNDNPYLLQVSVPGEYEISSVEDVNCAGETFGMVEVLETVSPTATFLEDVAFCEGEVGTLTIELTGAGPWDLTYAINGLDQDIISTTDDSILINMTEEGNYTISSLIDQNCLTTSLSSANVIVYELPEASIGGSLTICENEPGAIVVDLIGTPGFNITYSIDGIIQDQLSPTEAGLFEFLVDETGNYELLTVEDLHCIGTATGSIDVEIAPLPTAIISGDFIICDGQQQLIPIILTGEPEWTISYTIDGFAQTVVSTSSASFNLPAVASGIYEITAVQDSFCTNEGEGFAEINYYPPISVDYSPDVSACIGDEASIWASAIGGIGAPYDYIWEADNLTEINDTLINILSEENTTVTLTVTDQCEYASVVNIPVIIHQLPPISITGEQNSCGPEFIQINNTTPYSYVGESCLWIINGDSIYDCNSSLDYYFSEPGYYDVSLAVTSPEGCYNVVEFNDYFEVFPLPTANFSFSPNDPDIINSEVYFANESSNDVVINAWTFSDEHVSTETSPSFIFPTEDGPDNWLVCLNVENEYGCLDSLCEMVIVKPGLLSHIPNSFTPDGDGLNEFFFPVLNGVDADEYDFRIYDRIGNLVFKTDDINGKWNGSNLNNKEYYTKDGLYTWQITAKLIGSTDKRTIGGAVLLLR